MDNNFQKRVQKIRKLEESHEEILNLKEAKKETVRGKGRKRNLKDFTNMFKMDLLVTS